MAPSNKSKTKGLPVPPGTPSVEQVGGGPEHPKYMDPRVAKTVELEGKAREARLGLTMIDLAADKWVFGMWNDRDTTRSNVQKIKDNFKTSVKNRRLESAVRLVVREATIDPSCLVQENELGGAIPNIQLRGELPERLPLASGRHRCTALREYIEDTDEKINSIKSELSTLAKREHVSSAHREKAGKFKTTLIDLKARRKILGPWLAEVYAEGMWSINFSCSSCHG